MPDPELEKAWAAVHANTPDGWYVGQPGYEERFRQWSMYAFDPSEEAVAGGSERQWTAVGQTELHCVQGDGTVLRRVEGRAVAEVVAY